MSLGPRPAHWCNWRHFLCRACACSPTKISCSFMWFHQFKVHCSTPLSVLFGSINCNQFPPLMETGHVFQAKFDCRSDTEGLQETLPCFWPSSPWASLYMHVCTLYFLCLFQFSMASRRPATDPTTGKEQKPELFCLGLQRLFINTTYVIPYWCSTNN